MAGVDALGLVLRDLMLVVVARVGPRMGGGGKSRSRERPSSGTRIARDVGGIAQHASPFKAQAAQASSPFAETNTENTNPVGAPSQSLSKVGSFSFGGSPNEISSSKDLSAFKKSKFTS